MTLQHRTHTSPKNSILCSLQPASLSQGEDRPEAAPSFPLQVQPCSFTCKRDIKLVSSLSSPPLLIQFITDLPAACPSKFPETPSPRLLLSLREKCQLSVQCSAVGTLSMQLSERLAGVSGDICSLKPLPASQRYRAPLRLSRAHPTRLVILRPERQMSHVGDKPGCSEEVCLGRQVEPLWAVRVGRPGERTTEEVHL